MTVPAGPSAYQQQPPSAYYAQRPVYEPLGTKQKRAAFWAGAIGLNLLNFGGSILAGTLVIGIIVLAFAGFSASADPTSGLSGFDEFLQTSSAPALFAVAAVIGLVFFVAGLFASVAILRRGSVERPWAVTWSAFGISIPIIGFLNFIGGVIGQFAAMASIFAAIGAVESGQTTPDESSAAIALGVGVGVFVLSILLVGAIGLLVWWWMAFAFRPRVVVGSRAVTRDTADGGAYGGFIGDGGSQPPIRRDDDGSGRDSSNPGGSDDRLDDRPGEGPGDRPDDGGSNDGGSGDGFGDGGSGSDGGSSGGGGDSGGGGGGDGGGGGGGGD